jgi:hypothetical protein
MHGLGQFIEGIQVEFDTFRSSSIVHIRRETNSTVHTLARNAATNFIDLMWLEDIHSSISDIDFREVVVPRS